MGATTETSRLVVEPRPIRDARTLRPSLRPLETPVGTGSILLSLALGSLLREALPPATEGEA